MPDREKVIKGLETCTRPGMTICYHDSHECPYEGYGCRFQMEVDALALLKEQPEIIRCKDCKWNSEKGFCKHPNGGAGNIRPVDWFCADGERKVSRE